MGLPTPLSNYIEARLVFIVFAIWVLTALVSIPLK